MNKNEIFEVFKKHAFSSELKEESVGDQFAEIIIRKLIEQYNKKTGNQLEQNDTPALSIEQASATESKKQEYIT